MAQLSHGCQDLVNNQQARAFIHQEGAILQFHKSHFAASLAGDDNHHPMSSCTT